MKLKAMLRTAIFAPFFGVFTLFQAALLVLAESIKQDSPFTERILGFWSRNVLRAAGIDCTAHGQEHIPMDYPVVFVSNHQSNFDIPVHFLTTQRPIRYLAKIELFQIPIFATAMRKAGVVPIPRETASTVRKEINAGIDDALARNMSLMIYPEGTRTRSGDLGTFKKGAFRIARDHGLQIVPVSLTGLYEAWPPGSKLVYGGHARVLFHPPIPTHADDDVAALRDKVHEIIADGIARLEATATS